MWSITLNSSLRSSIEELGMGINTIIVLTTFSVVLKKKIQFYTWGYSWTPSPKEPPCRNMSDMKKGILTHQASGSLFGLLFFALPALPPSPLSLFLLKVSIHSDQPWGIYTQLQQNQAMWFLKYKQWHVFLYESSTKWHMFLYEFNSFSSTKWFISYILDVAKSSEIYYFW